MALFLNHRDRVPAELERRLLPKRVIQPFDKRKLTAEQRRGLFKPKPKTRVICLPDYSNGYNPPGQASAHTAREIIHKVCKQYDVSVADFYSRARFGRLIDARSEACYMFAVTTNYSLSRIGNAIKRDHSSVLNLIERYCEETGVPFPRERHPNAKGYSGDAVSGDADRAMAEPEIRQSVSERLTEARGGSDCKSSIVSTGAERQIGGRAALGDRGRVDMEQGGGGCRGLHGPGHVSRDAGGD